jgi:hypothetical protein
MSNTFKVVVALLLSLVFGFLQAFMFGELTQNQIFGSTMVILLPMLVITLIIEAAKFFIQKDYKFHGAVKVFWITGLVMFIVGLLSLIGNWYTNSKAADIDRNSYKKEVQINNSRNKKAVGAVPMEFLNENHLYENYAFHYSMRFPEHYKIDYGTGKYSEVQASELDSGFVISVSVAASGVKKILGEHLSMKLASDTMVKGMYNNFQSPTYKKRMESEYENRGLSDVELFSVRLTNYNNRFYIDSRYKANAILDGVKYPLVIADFVTFHDDEVYHFFFRTWQPFYDEKWKSLITNTMSNVLISQGIDNK